MGLSPMSRSTYEPPVVVGRITFAPFAPPISNGLTCQRCRGGGKVVGGMAEWTDCPECHGHGSFEHRLVPATIIREVAIAQALPNPNPQRFEVRSVEALGRGLVVEVVYPDCTTYEGRKVLVFTNAREIDVRRATVLDPHFTDKAPEDALVPVARFEPTDRGWKLARICAAAL